jgi:hypothetical protein
VLLGSDDPAELVGHGPITADQARMIIQDGTLQRLLCDPVSGIVLDYGRTRYEPPETLKQFITARDGTCRTPGCDRPADRCQIDHIDPYHPGQPAGGNTTHTHLDSKCHHHHRAKDGGGFTNTRDPNGTSHWITPLGRHYAEPPNQAWDPTPAGPDAGRTKGADAGRAGESTEPGEPDWADRFPPELKAMYTPRTKGPTGPAADHTEPPKTQSDQHDATIINNPTIPDEPPPF